jgi:putative MATE family efflux protein
VRRSIVRQDRAGMGRHGTHLDREIARLAVPALGALIAEPLYVLVDTAVVGHLGTPQLAGLGVASTLLLTGYSIFNFLAYGTTGTVARLLGAGHRDRAAAQGVQSLWLALGIGVALAVVGLASADALVGAMGATGEAREHAVTYLRISMAGVPALTIVLAGTGYLRGLQDTRTPLAVALGTAAANVVLELWFVLVLDWGVAGSAWSTVLVQVVGAAVYVRAVARDVRRNDVPVRPDRRALVALSRVSADLFVRTSALRAALLVATSVAARIGTTDVAAHQIVFEIWNLCALVLDSIAIAAQALIGRYLGASDVATTRLASRRMVELSLMAGAAFSVVLLATRFGVAGVFTDDTAVTALAAFLLVHVALMQPVSGVVFALDGVLIGAGDLRYLAWAMVASTAAFVPAALAVLAFDLGIGWLWGAIWVLMVVRLVTLVSRWRSDAWLVTGPERKAEAR